MIRFTFFLLIYTGLMIPEWLYSQNIPELNNPMSVDYLKNNLTKVSPKLVLTPAIRKELRAKIKTVPEIGNYYQAIKLNAEKILEEPLLERIQTGRRLLAVSREMLYRMGILGMVYSMEENPDILKRINDELTAVCRFSDWNPSHYLDVAEMSLAVALGMDWTGDQLPADTRKLCLSSLINKGIKPSYNEKGNVGWINGTNNWNQVCHGGMIAAAIMIAAEDPALASQTLHRALQGMPYALAEYMPDGVYPEGATYWEYGTSFSVLTSAMLTSAFGTDFGLAAYPGFLKSAEFRQLMDTPSGWYFNFADCGDQRGNAPNITLAWFATQTGDPKYFEKDKFLQSPSEMGKLSRIAGPGLVWLSLFKPGEFSKTPLTWKGEGDNPVAIFKNKSNDPYGFYLGTKGGRATVSHGNMDAGSFVFELNGVRWSIDPGNQNYHDLEKIGFNLWQNCQTCQRWTLLTKNNYGHSTLTVNDSLHVNSGYAPVVSFQEGPQPKVTYDLSAVIEDELKSALRSFTKDSETSFIVEDELELSEKTHNVTWQMMTTAEISFFDKGVILNQDGKKLVVENLNYPEIRASIVSLDPAPLEIDRQIPGLKRLEFRFPAYVLSKKNKSLVFRLAASN